MGPWEGRVANGGIIWSCLFWVNPGCCMKERGGNEVIVQHWFRRAHSLAERRLLSDGVPLPMIPH